MFNKVLSLIALICISCSAVNAQVAGDRPAPQKGAPTLKEKVTIVPAGTIIPALTTYELNTNHLLTGQTVTVILPVDFYYHENLIAPKGSTVTGNVVEAIKAKQNGIDGRLGVRFSLITTPYGFQIPIAGIIKTKDSSGVLVGENKTLSSALSEKPAKENTEMSLVKAVWNFGENVVIPADKVIEILLTQPVTANPTVYSLN